MWRVFKFCLTVFLMLALGVACSRQDVSKAQLKTIDSLQTIVSSHLKDLKSTDTLLLQKLISRFSYYREFIEQNVNDTVSKVEADQIQLFYSGGKNLINYENNRKELIQRFQIINSQLIFLSEDIKNQKVDELSARSFLQKEMAEMKQVTEFVPEQQKLFYTASQDMKNSIKFIEEVIRKHNNGELPAIIKDSITF